MKKILLILDGIVAKKLLHRITHTNTGDNYYDVIYINDQTIPEKKPSNFTFYKFDPTSFSKLVMVLDKDTHYKGLIALNSKNDTLNVVENIRKRKPNLQLSVLDFWEMEIEEQYVNIYKGIDTLANGLLEKLPNIPIIAQNIGLKQGEIMEIRVPFGSSYTHKYIGSIEQVDWKIFGLYRNDKFIDVKPSLIIRPNDNILVIGKPKVLMQVYHAISKNEGQFPMPFGHNAYFYIDLAIQKEDEVINALQEAKFLDKHLKNQKLIVKITRPTNVQIMDKIKEEIKDNPSIVLEIDYANTGFDKIISKDLKSYDIGILILSYEFFKNKEQIKKLAHLKVPILKLGKQRIEKTKDTIVILEDKYLYEQISPILFDISSQLKTKTKIYNLNPLDTEDRSELIDHFDNLGKIFDQKIEVINDEKNPIRVLRQQKDILQIMPLKSSMFNRGFFMNLFYTDSDVLAFFSKEFNQLFIPIVEE